MGIHPQNNLIRSIIKKVTLLMLPVMICTGMAYAIGPGSSWQYCRRLTLSSATPGDDFQVKVIMTTAVFGNPYTHINTDGSDIRFYDINDNSCSYYIETWNRNGTSTLWVKVPVSGTVYLYMYYGYASAPPVSSSDNTFIFYDHFPGSSLDGNKWGSYVLGPSSAGISVTGSNVTLSCGTNSNPPVAYGAQIIGKTSFDVSDGVIVEEVLGGTATNRCGSRGSMCGASDMLPSSSGFNLLDQQITNQWAAQEIGGPAVFGFPGKQCDGVSITQVYNYQPNGNNADGTMPGGTVLGVYFAGSNIYYYRNGSQVGTSNSTPPTGTVYPIFSSLVVPNCMDGHNNQLIMDLVRVRKFSGSDPTVTFGAEDLNTLTAAITAQTNVTCNGYSDGSATVTAGGGTSPYSYLWSNGQTTATAVNLSAATYSVTVTDSRGMPAVTSATITEPDALTLSSTSTDVSCYAGNDGTITVTAGGGISPYQYSNDNGTTWTPGSNPYTFTGLVANHQYKIRVKDSNGCTSPVIP